MSCCAPGAGFEDRPGPVNHPLPRADEITMASRDLGDGLIQTELSVPSAHCGACMASIERSLGRLEGVEGARMNLSTRRVAVRWRGETPPRFVETLAGIGYPAHLHDPAAAETDDTLPRLIRAMGVSGFAAGNIMLLSVSVWSGADGATRDLFHFISALIAIPALIFGGGIFYRSAWSALSHWRMNMDVPIALGISLAYALSLYDTIHSGRHAYFDAVTMLLFFLLVGRTLDHLMRDKARSAVLGLARLAPRGAIAIGPDGTRNYLPVDEITQGMRLFLAAGDRVPVDARVMEGASDLDCSLVTGESAPQPMRVGDTLRAGTLNLTGPLTVEALAPAADSFLAEMRRMMEAAEGGRARYRRIADRASALYSPVVHLTALVTFLGWMVADGDWHRAVTIAIAVLIITCPCALGLAVPIVQVVAARRLFENGVMVRDGAAMERLAEIDTAIFDKTGTLTLGRPRLADSASIDPRHLALAAAIAAGSRHPVAQAIAAHADSSRAAPRFEDFVEHPGLGIEARLDGAVWRLGRAKWAAPGRSDGEDGTVLARDGAPIAAFRVEDTLRPDARSALKRIAAMGAEVEILSGDTPRAVSEIAGELDVERSAAGLLPAGKVERLTAIREVGRKALMVGDGLNDAPALAAAHVSIAPATAADIGRNAADFVFLRDSLNAIPLAIDVARRADRLIRQNLVIAVVYNAIAVPIAILGHVTPLIAAVAMSLSSLIVIGNALRLRPGSGESGSRTVIARRREAPAT